MPVRPAGIGKTALLPTDGARRLAGTGIGMLIATRSSPPAGLPSLPLGPLDRADSHHVLAAYAPEPLEPDVAALLADLAEGNPGALVGLAQSLTPQQCRGEAAPPDCHRDQLDPLPPATRWLLLLAATAQLAGPEPIEVAELTGATASGHHERDSRTELARLL